MIYLFLSEGDWTPMASTLQAHASAVGWKTPAGFPNLDTCTLKDRAFLAANLPSFSHATISINLLVVTVGAGEAGSQASMHKITSLSAIEAATEGDSNIIDMLYICIQLSAGC